MMYAAMDASSVHLLILVLLACAVGAYLFYLERREKPTRADRLSEQYGTLTEEMLHELPDEQVLTAVIANIMAKHDGKKPQPYYRLPLLSAGRATVYRVWLVCRETESGNLAALLTRRSRPLCEQVAADFETIGAVQCAEQFRAVWDDTADGTPLSDDTAAAFRRACEGEQPLDLCVSYIRANPLEFTD